MILKIIKMICWLYFTDITKDSTTIHPDLYCEKCRTVITKSKKAATEGKVYMHSVKAFDGTVMILVDALSVLYQWVETHETTKE